MTVDDLDPRDLLDALLDGELSGPEEEAVRTWLAANPDGGRELEALGEVRAMVRDLPPVEPPAGFYEGLLRDGLPEDAIDGEPATVAALGVVADDGTVAPRRQHRPRRSRRRRGLVVGGIGAVAAVAASVVLVLGITPATDQIVPPVAAFADRHDAMATSGHDASPTASDYEPVAGDEVDSMDAPYLAPPKLGDFARRSVYRDDGIVHVMYGRGADAVSIYEQRGDVDWNRIPADGQRLVVGDDKAWETTMGTEAVLVIDLDEGIVLTVVSAVPAPDMMLVARSVPEPPAPSMLDRMSQRASRLMRSLTGNDDAG